ncbi:MAG: hypothetical protein Q8Q48_03325 [Candidatus Staskawiczbacteria bacterium]|nr:hypothetical protein [Candidatus Staskawiczbacteria bacterium]
MSKISNAMVFIIVAIAVLVLVVLVWANWQNSQPAGNLQQKTLGWANLTLFSTRW